MTDPYTVSIDIEAPPETVFDHFVRPDLLVRWMGDYARLEARNGGAFSVDINGVLIRGEYLSLDPPRSIDIAWGEAGNASMPPGATRLSITFQAIDGGTRVSLTHSGLEDQEAAKHAIGWPHFLDRLAAAAAGGDPGLDPWATQPPPQDAY
jgi:uncharacterized protein YndB with AHSA1/START domain